MPASIERVKRAALLALLLAPALARADDFGPWSTPAAPAVAERLSGPVPITLPERPSALGASSFYVPFKFYQQVLSPIDGPRCAHRPTCSLYALQAVRKHPLLGAFLAIDRLWRGPESSSLRILPLTEDAEGNLHYLDPLEGSDFWFAR